MSGRIGCALVGVQRIRLGVIRRRLPMHTGRGEDTQGQLIAAEFIQDIRCWRNDKEVLTIKCGTATSRNPFFAFQLKGGAQGDVITLRWVDNTGAKGRAETEVQ